MRIRHVLAGLLVIAGVAAVSADELPDAAPLEEPRFVSVGVGAIPRAVVASLAQDRAGFMWLATGDGVVRFDGYQFRPVERESTNPLARNLGWVRAMLAARDGRVWLGTESQGLLVYDPQSDRVHPPHANGDDDESELAADVQPVVRALAEDLDGAIWSGSTGGGVQRIDPRTGAVASWRHEPAPGSLPDDRVESLLVDRDGTLWVGTWRGLARRTRDSDHFEPVFSTPSGNANLEGATVQALFQTSDGRIWVGTKQGDLAIVDPTDGSGVLLPRVSDPDVGGVGAVTGFAQVPRDRVWVARSSGIDILALHDGRRLQTVRRDPRQAGGLAGNEVTALLRDQAGRIWVAGLGLGLQRHDLDNRAIRVRRGDSQPGSVLQQLDARSITELDNGQIWIAARGVGVAVLDQSLRLQAVLPATSGKTQDSVAGRPLRGEALVQIADGSVWLAAENRLYQFSRERQLLRITQAPDQSLWVGTAQGLFRIAPGADAMDVVRAQAGSELGSQVVIGLLFDRNNALWIDTAVAGLHRLQQPLDTVARFERISERHGIVSRPFGVNLLQDAGGRIWTQLYVYDPATDEMHELTAADGVNIGTPWFQSYVRLRSGRFLFGGSNGLLAVDAEQFDASVYAPPLVVSELQVNGQVRRVGQLVQGLTLAPDDRSFSLEFAALDYSDPARLQYAYQLQGFDPDWLPTRADRRVSSYSNLGHGQYLLRVRATNSSGNWSPHELAIPVWVQPAWWQQWWFGLFVLAASAMLIFAIVQWRTRQLRLRQTDLQAKVRERTTELESLTELLRAESAALQEASLTDPLTGLRNRRFLMRHVDVDVAVSMRRHENQLHHGGVPGDDADLLFFMVDIDHFKEVNDRFGHAAGDAVLMQMRSRLEQVFRDADYMVRWGGEEFLLVARWISRDHATDLAERARRAVAEQPFTLNDGQLIDCTCSLGFACFPIAPRFPRMLDWSETVSLADAALLLAKTRGRNGWVGVRDAGALTEAQLRARPSPAPWIAQSAITVLVS